MTVLTVLTLKYKHHIFHHVSAANLGTVSKTRSLILEFASNIKSTELSF
jgi:hypothetical protein